ncbi:MAG TPA: hypothetical protein V6C81_18020 [Planktothrix sp.]
MNIKVLLIASILAVGGMPAVVAQGGPPAQFKSEPVRHQNKQLLFRQYYSAGEKAEKAGNHDLAKRYYVGALGALEQQSQHRHDTIKSKVDGKTYRLPFANAAVQQLEQKLVSMYPTDWSKTPGTQSQQLALRQEQVSVLYRMAQLNKAHAGARDGFTEHSEQRYLAAVEELKKAKGEQSDNAQPADK